MFHSGTALPNAKSNLLLSVVMLYYNTLFAMKMSINSDINLGSASIGDWLK